MNLPDDIQERPTVRQAFLIYTDQYELLRKVAYETHVSQAEHVRRALATYFEKLGVKGGN